MSTTFWPGEEYSVPYSLDDLYLAVGQYSVEHPSASPVKIHEKMVSRFGACEYAHVKAVWELLKARK